jgi:hypothetical protein
MCMEKIRWFFFFRTRPLSIAIMAQLRSMNNSAFCGASATDSFEGNRNAISGVGFTIHGNENTVAGENITVVGKDNTLYGLGHIYDSTCNKQHDTLPFVVQTQWGITCAGVARPEGSELRVKMGNIGSNSSVAVGLMRSHLVHLPLRVNRPTRLYVEP